MWTLRTTAGRGRLVRIVQSAAPQSCVDGRRGGARGALASAIVTVLRELEFLRRLALAAGETPDATSLVRLVISETTGAMGVDVCSVYLLEAGARTLVLTATNGLSQTGVGRVRLRIGEGVTGTAAGERRPVVVADVRQEPRFRWLAGVDQARFVAMCSVPIISAERLVGVLNVQTDEPREFGEDEVRFLAAIAAQVAGALERAGLQERLERQVADLRRSEEIHRRFTELALNGGGLGAICDEIARQSGGPIALYDDEGERLAPEGLDTLPVRLPAPREGECEGAEVRAVRAGRDILGWLAVGPGEDVPADVRRRAHEHGLTVLALELSRERAAAEAERRLRGDLVEELLSTTMTEADAARLAARAARLGYRLRRDMWVLVVEPDEPSAARALAERTSATRLMRAVSAAAETRNPGSMVVERGGALVILVPEPAEPDDAERCALAVLAAAGQLTGGASFSCGVSRDRGGPVAFHALVEQARLAIRVGRRLQRVGEVHAYRRLGAERLLLAVSPAEDLHDFVEEWLGPLERQRAQGRAAAPLVETIEALAGAGWSPSGAARRLNVHVNTLLYRVQRAREVTGRDLDDPDVRLAMTLALRARTLIGTPEPVERRPARAGRAGALSGAGR